VGAHEDVKVSVGDVAVLRKYAGTEVELDGEEHRIVDAEDVLGLSRGKAPTTASKRSQVAAPSEGPLFRVSQRDDEDPDNAWFLYPLVFVALGTDLSSLRG
jgi:hypothetical protein